MPTKPLERLLFIQGGLCFFCEEPMPKSEASVEHLFASANGGSNADENCVACCKSVNSLLGSMSLKEKFQVVLRQRGNFKCPSQSSAKKNGKQSAVEPTSSAQKKSAIVDVEEKKLVLVIANLKQRGNSKPRTVKTLTSTVASLYPQKLSTEELNRLLGKLESTGNIVVKDNKVTYAF